MISPIRIRFGDTAGTVFHDCIEGRPSSVTSLTVYEDIQSDTSTAETAFGSPAVETNPNTTFDAASGASQTDPTIARLTATTSCTIGRRYLAMNAHGDREWCEVIDVHAADYVTLRSALVHDYVATDTFQSTRISATVNSSWCADESNLSHPLRPYPRWRAVFLYVYGGVTSQGVEHFDLTRYVWQHAVTAADVDRRSRGWLHRLAVDDRNDAGVAAIEQAAHIVKLDIWKRNLADYALRNSVVLNELITLKAIALVAKQAVLHGATSAAAMELAERDYQTELSQFIDAGIVPAQSTEDGAAALVERTPVWRR